MCSFAQDNGTSKNGTIGVSSESSLSSSGNKVPVCVDFTLADKLGRILGLKLQEKIALSGLFRLVKKKDKCIRISIKSIQEFKNSPFLRSACSVVWTMYYGEDVLSNFLDHQVVVLEPQTIDMEAENILALTSNISDEYSYLLKNP